jgi:hypothetical protein
MEITFLLPNAKATRKNSLSEKYTKHTEQLYQTFLNNFKNITEKSFEANTVAKLTASASTALLPITTITFSRENSDRDCALSTLFELEMFIPQYDNNISLGNLTQPRDIWDSLANHRNGGKEDRDKSILTHGANRVLETSCGHASTFVNFSRVVVDSR